MANIKILFIGDIVHKIGREAVKKALPKIKKDNNIDLVIANGEHASTGYGITEKAYGELLDYGVDFLTSGNHIFRKKEIIPFLEEKSTRIIRPANFPEGTPGRYFDIVKVKNKKIAILNFMGRVFMKDETDSPFRKADQVLKEVNKIKIKIVDFHADITSEKLAFGHYLDGRVTAVLGSHTHVPTADARILEKGTAYVSDTGMVGPVESVLGVKKEIIVEKYLTAMPGKHESDTEGKCFFNSVMIEINEKGNAVEIKRIDKIVEV